MLKMHPVVLAAAALLLPATASAAALKVKVDDFAKGKPIPTQYAFCVPAEPGHSTLGPNKNPRISWSGAPKGTQSYAIIVSDPDVPTDFTNLNKEGKTIPAKQKRQVFYHMVLIDIPASATELAEGADSAGVTAHGKPPGPAKLGVRGINDYTKFMASNEAMKGNYGGYDGPCPPWNDMRVHHYHFAVYALGVPSLQLSGNFTAPDAIAAMKGHVLAKGEVVGIYSQNPTVMKKIGAK